MFKLIRIVGRLPIPKGTKLSWQRHLTDRAYAKDIAAAWKAKEKDKARSLQEEHRFEIAMHDEEEDAYFIEKLIRRARKLRVPIPHRYNEDQSESEFWCEGNNTGSWFLTTRGFAALREEIRKELKARHETRSHWVVWLSALTGLIGAITGLVALMSHRAP